MPFYEGNGGLGAMQMLDVAGGVMLGQVALAKFAVLVMGGNSGCAAGGTAAGSAGVGAWAQTMQPRG